MAKLSQRTTKGGGGTTNRKYSGNKREGRGEKGGGNERVRMSVNTHTFLLFIGQIDNNPLV